MSPARAPFAFRLRSRLARLCLKIARGFASLAEAIAPWVRADYSPPAAENRSPTLRELALALARAKLARWRLLRRIDR